MEQEAIKLKLYEFLEEFQEIVCEGRICDNESQRQEVWTVRESVVVALMKKGKCLKYDVSLPSEKFQELVDHVRSELGRRQSLVSGYGHIGDGNLHLNICLSDELSNAGKLDSVYFILLYLYLLYSMFEHC